MQENSSDVELIKAYSSTGSEMAFRDLVQRHAGLVYSTALRQVGDKTLAEEVMQHVFIALAEKAPSLGRHHTIAGWLHRTTLLEAKAHLRKEMRRRRREDVAASLSELDSTGNASANPLLPLLDEALMGLRSIERQAIIVRYFQDGSLGDVGRTLGIREEAARKRVRRALDRLTAFFERRGFAVSTSSMIGMLTASCASTVPASVVAASAQAGLTAGVSAGAGGIQLFGIQIMALTKTQTTVALVILAAAPLLWQKRAQANIAEQRNQLASVMASTQMEIEQWENQASQKMSQTRILQTEHQNADLLLQQKKARLLAGEAAPDYEWKDELPLARVPKELLNRLPLNSVRDRQGTLDPRVSQLLQLTEWERMRTQESMDRFLAEYQQAEAKRMKLVAPESKDLQEGSPEDVKVFEVSGMNEDLVRTQNGLFEDLREVLGDQRLAIFRKGLRDWMPLDDDNWGISTGMAIFPDDYRMRIYKPEPESGFVKWSVEVKDRGSFFATVKLDQMEEWIPPHFRVQVQEWLNLARPNPLSETDAVELNF